MILDGIDIAYRPAGRHELFGRLRCGLCSSAGTFVGGDADALRLRCLAYAPPSSRAWALQEPWCLVLIDGAAPPVLGPQDFGDGWLASASVEFAYSQSPDALFGAGAATPAPDGGSFLVRRYLLAGAAPPQSACYRVDADLLVPDAPAGAFAVGDLVEHEGDVWAAGWAYADAVVATAAASDQGFVPTDVETTPTTDALLADPLVPTRGDAGFRAYDVELDRWVRAGDAQQVARLRPAVWRRASSTGVWSELPGPAWARSRAVEFYGPSRPFRLASSPWGVFVVCEGFVAGRHPVLSRNGEPMLAAHPTYLVEPGGFVRFVGHAAAIADAGGGVLAIGPRSSWSGPDVRHVTTIAAEVVDPAGALDPVGSESLLRPRRGTPTLWRGAFHLPYELLEPDPQLTALVRYGGGAPRVVWARRDAQRWASASFRSDVLLAASPALLHVHRGGSLDAVPEGDEPADETREQVAALNSTLAQSTRWEWRVGLAFAGLDDGAHAFALARADYPYSLPVLAREQLGVRDLFRSDLDQRIARIAWHHLHWPARVSVARAGVDWGWEPLVQGLPEVSAIALDWGWEPPAHSGPTVESAAIEWADGTGDAPEVESAAIAWGDGTGPAPELDLASLAWQTTSGDEPGDPDVGSAAIDWSDGTGDAPEVESAAIAWEAGPAEAADPVAVSSAAVAWSDGAGAASEVHSVRMEWARPGVGPAVGEKYLIVTSIDASRACSAVRVDPVGLSAEQAAACRVLVRADRESLAVDLWGSYQAGALEEDIALERPGNAVRVVVVAPAAVPDDVDMLVSYERS